MKLIYDWCETENESEILSNIRSISTTDKKIFEMFQRIFDEEETE